MNISKYIKMFFRFIIFSPLKECNIFLPFLVYKKILYPLSKGNEGFLGTSQVNKFAEKGVNKYN